MQQSASPPPQALPDWLTEGYFRFLFRRKSPGEEVTVQKVTVNFADEERIHGKMVRAIVEIASSSGAERHSYIVKCPQPGPFSTTPASTNMYRTEALILGKVIPAMEHVLEAVSPGKFGQLAPRLADFGADLNQFIMTDDLTDQGFTTVSRQNGLDLEHSLAYAKHLGIFHAASAAVLETFESDITSIPLLVDLEESKNLNGFIEKSMESVMSVLESWEDGSQHVEVVRQLASTLPRRLAQANRRRDSRLKVLCHGDMFVNNILFRRDESGKVNGVRLVDFQLSRVGSFADDLSGFLVSAVSDEVMAGDWNEVLEAYRGALNEVLLLLGLGGRALSQEAVMQEMREQRAVAQFAAFHMLPHTRVVGDVDLQDGGHAFTSPAYQRLLRVLLPRFHTLGWLDEYDCSPEDSSSQGCIIQETLYLDSEFGKFHQENGIKPAIFTSKCNVLITHSDYFPGVVKSKSPEKQPESSRVKCLGVGRLQLTPYVIKTVKMETPVTGKVVSSSEETLGKFTIEKLQVTITQSSNGGEDKVLFRDYSKFVGLVIRSIPLLKKIDIKHCLAFIRFIALLYVFSSICLGKYPNKISGESSLSNLHKTDYLESISKTAIGNSFYQIQKNSKQSYSIEKDHTFQIYEKFQVPELLFSSNNNISEIVHILIPGIPILESSDSYHCCKTVIKKFRHSNIGFVHMYPPKDCVGTVKNHVPKNLINKTDLMKKDELNNHLCASKQSELVISINQVFHSENLALNDIEINTHNTYLYARILEYFELENKIHFKFPLACESPLHCEGLERLMVQFHAVL